MRQKRTTKTATPQGSVSGDSSATKKDAPPTLVDNSTLATLATCTTKAAVRNVMGYTSREESAPLLCGKAVHVGIETFLRGGSVTDALARFAEMYQEWSAANLAPGNPREYSNVRKILQRWLEENPLERLPYRVHPDKVEIYFSVPLNDETEACPVCAEPHQAGQFMLTGLIDAIVGSLDGRLLYPLDHKTTGSFNRDFVRKFRNDSQISGYTYALSYLTGQPPTGALINVIEIKKLPSDPKRKCKEHGTKYDECGILHAKYQFFSPDRNPDQIASWRSTAIHLAHTYRNLFAYLGGRKHTDLTPRERFELVQALPTEGEFNGGCDWCELFDYCTQGRHPAMAESTLFHNPWIDEDGLTEARKKEVLSEDHRRAISGSEAHHRGAGRGTLRRPTRKAEGAGAVPVVAGV